MWQGVGEVGLDLGDALDAGETLGEEILSGFEGLAIFSGFLLRHELRIRAHLGFDLFAFQQVTYLMDKEVVRCTVAHEMVDVAQQIQVLLRAHDDETEKQVFLQVERMYELMFEGIHLCLFECFLGYVDSCFVHHLLVDGLDDIGFLGRKMDEEFRVVKHRLAYGLTQCVGLYVQRHLSTDRHVIERRGRVLHALEIDTELSKAQGSFAHLRLDIGDWRFRYFGIPMTA